jgi:hypothetical protein
MSWKVIEGDVNELLSHICFPNYRVAETRVGSHPLLPSVIIYVPALDRTQLSRGIYSRICMPKSSVSLKQRVGLGQIKIKNKPSQSELLDVADFSGFKERGNCRLKFVVSLPCAPFRDLLARYHCLAFARRGIAKLLDCGSLDLQACRWRMCLSVHSIFRSSTRFSSGQATRTAQPDNDSVVALQSLSNITGAESRLNPDGHTLAVLTAENRCGKTGATPRAETPEFAFIQAGRHIRIKIVAAVGARSRRPVHASIVPVDG